MHVLSLVNQKGGCGKTTTAVNLAGALARTGERALLVDLDPQAHATLSVGCAIEDEPSLVDVLLERASPDDALRRAPGDFDLLPASEELAEFEEIAARSVRPERALAGLLEPLEGRWDWVVLDCPPRADGVLTSNALYACDTALLVVEAGAFALQGAVKALRILARNARELDRAFAVRVVGTMFDQRTRLGKELLIGMQSQFGEALFDAVIHSSQRLREAAAYGVPVQVLDPRSRAARDFEELAREVAQHAREIAAGAPRRVRAAEAAAALAQGVRPVQRTLSEAR